MGGVITGGHNPARSRTADDHLGFTEVKDRIEGAEEFWVTSTEALTRKNAGTGFRLALVSIRPEGAKRDTIRDIVVPFRDVGSSEGIWP